MTLDEVGEEEEEKITPRTRGRPRKRTRQTPGKPSVPTVSIHLFIKCCSLFNNNCPFYAVTLRRSARGKDKTSKDEEEKEAVQSATSSEKDESSLSADGQQEPQKTQAKAEPGNQTLEGRLDGGRSRTDVKGKKNKS